jgi:AcrR family transcriptional regulator
MARKPARAKADSPESPTRSPTTPPTGSDRERIVATLMALLAEKPIERIDLTEIAAGAGVTLGALRGEFSSKLAILAAHAKAIDRAVLEGGDGDMSEEPPRERLFDVLMRRIEAQTPHKEALASLMRSARRNPGLALALNTMAVRSQQWMLAAAGIHSSGPLGAVRAQGLAVLFARVLRTFVHDDDEGHARTMAELDRALARGSRLMSVVGDLCRFVPGGRPRRRHRRDWDDEQDDEATVAA